MARTRLPGWMASKLWLESKPASVFTEAFLQSDAATKIYHRQRKLYLRDGAKVRRAARLSKMHADYRRRN